MKYLLITLFSFLTLGVSSQIHEKLETDKNLIRKYWSENIPHSTDTNFCYHYFDTSKTEEIDEFIRFSKQLGLNENEDQIIRIPLVFHIFYRTSIIFNQPIPGDGRVSKEQIYSAVDHLNQAYSSDHSPKEFGPNWNVEFYIANIGPDGEPFEGIIYYNMDTVPWLSESLREEFINFGILFSGIDDNDFKPQTSIDHTRYLNIWSTPEINGNNGQGFTQGYASNFSNSSLDGIVIQDNALGFDQIGYFDANNDGELSVEENSKETLKYYTDQNWVLTHEIGHYPFNLFHTFFQTFNCFVETDCSSQGDRICDTEPTRETSNCFYDECPDAPNDNYMGYVSESCTNRLTHDQKERGRLFISQQNQTMIDSFYTTWEPKMTDVEISIVKDDKFYCSQDDYQIKVRNIGDSVLSNIEFAYGNSQINDTIYEPFALLPTQYRFITVPNLGTDLQTTWLKILKINTFPVSSSPIPFNTNIGNNELVVEFLTDFSPSHNYWEVINKTTNEVVSSGNYTSTNRLHYDTLCIKGSNYKFVLYDEGNDGLGTDSANVKIYLNGNLCNELPDNFSDEWVVESCQQLSQTQQTVIYKFNPLGSYREVVDKIEGSGFYVIYENGEKRTIYKE